MWQRCLILIIANIGIIASSWGAGWGATVLLRGHNVSDVGVRMYQRAWLALLGGELAYCLVASLLWLGVQKAVQCDSFPAQLAGWALLVLGGLAFFLLLKFAYG